MFLTDKLIDDSVEIPGKSDAIEDFSHDEESMAVIFKQYSPEDRR
jgi:hypothetical protein